MELLLLFGFLWINSSFADQVPCLNAFECVGQEIELDSSGDIVTGSGYKSFSGSSTTIPSWL